MPLGALGNGLVLGLLLLQLVVQLRLAVNGGTNHSHAHSEAVEPFDRDVEEEDAEENSETLLKVAADRHCQGTGNLVGVEGGNVEQEGEESVTGQRSDGWWEGDVAGPDQI